MLASEIDTRAGSARPAPETGALVRYRGGERRSDRPLRAALARVPGSASDGAACRAALIGARPRQSRSRFFFLPPALQKDAMKSAAEIRPSASACSSADLAGARWRKGSPGSNPAVIHAYLGAKS